MSPVAMLAYACVVHGLLDAFGAFGGHGEGLHSVGCGYETAVAVGLFYEMFARVDDALAVAVQLLKPLHWWEVER